MQNQHRRLTNGINLSMLALVAAAGLAFSQPGQLALDPADAHAPEATSGLTAAPDPARGARPARTTASLAAAAIADGGVLTVTHPRRQARTLPEPAVETAFASIEAERTVSRGARPALR